MENVTIKVVISVTQKSNYDTNSIVQSSQEWAGTSTLSEVESRVKKMVRHVHEDFGNSLNDRIIQEDTETNDD